MRCVAAGAIALLLSSGASAQDAIADYDRAFVDAFADVCMPQGRTYDETVEAALAQGWSEVDQDDHPELDAHVQWLQDAAERFHWSNLTLYARWIHEKRHHLIVEVAETTFVWVEDVQNPPGVADALDLVLGTQVRCQLYDFDATTALQPDAVVARLGREVCDISEEEDGTVAHYWADEEIGCTTPFYGDETDLLFFPDGSEQSMIERFSGLALGSLTRRLSP